jgi:phosphoglycolate phosphatase
MSLLNPKMVMFDLDGTLVDSAPDVSLSVNLMLADLKYPQRKESQIRHWIGNGSERLLKRALTEEVDGEPDYQLLQQAKILFKKHYAKNICVKSALYPGVNEALQYLKSGGYTLACVTNKPQLFTDKLLTALDIFEDFRIIVSGDTLEKSKPDPLPLLHAAAFCQVAPDDCLMIGDSMIDIQAAHAAGIRILCVSYGYNRGADIQNAGVDHVLDTLADLPQILNNEDNNI